MKIKHLIHVFLLSSCVYDPGRDERLKIVNETNYPFSVYYNSDTVPEYPSVNHTDIYLEDSVNVKDTFRLSKYDYKPWSHFFESSKNKKLNLFIYNIDSLKIHGIDKLIKRKSYKRVTYSKDQIEKLNWTVVIKD